MGWQNDDKVENPKQPHQAYLKTNSDPAVWPSLTSRPQTGTQSGDKMSADVHMNNPASDPAVVCISPGVSNQYAPLVVSDAAWTQIPVFAGRKELAIQNNTAFNARIRHDDPGAGIPAATGSGMLIAAGAERNYSIQGQIFFIRMEGGGVGQTLDTEALS